MNQKNLLKGSIIALLCVALIAGIVLSVAQPGKPDDDRLSNVETRPTTGENSTPTDGPDVEPPLGTGPAEPHDPIVPPTVPPVSQPEPKPTEPAPVEPEATEPDSTEPEEPENKVTTLTGNVSSENSTVTEDTFFGDGDISVMVPAGAQLEDNTTSLTLTITEKDSSDSGVQLDAGQTMLPLDVHIEGISAENTAPITISLGTILPKGLNIGNYSLYHVENGVAVKMNAVPTANELSAHNDFVYNPADGNVIISVHSFSEIAVVNEGSAWMGKVNHDWYNPNKDTLYIYNADQLWSFSQIVGGMAEGIAQDSFKGKTVILRNDVNIGDMDSENGIVFYPIGYYNTTGCYAKQSGISVESGIRAFQGTFDGNGNTISNFYQNTWEMFGDYNEGYSGTPNHYKDAMGLFAATYGATIKNLNIDNFQSDGEFTPTGCVVAYAGGPNMVFENIILTNCNPRVYNTGNGGIVGLNYNSTSGTADSITFRNVTVDNSNKITALWGSWDVACGGIMGRVRENSKHDHANGEKNTVHFENCHVSAIIDVYNDVCANYQYYQYRYCGMFIGTVDYIDDVPSIGMSCVTAANCTYKIGTWNEYWYCELVANSLASYTHDHQFSRLEKISSLSEIQDESGNWIKKGNFVIPATNEEDAVCYHIVEKDGVFVQHKHEDSGKETVGGEEILKEDRQHYMMSFNQLFTGYGWGSKPVYKFDGITHSGEEESEKKFAVKDTFLQLEIKQGDSIDVEEIFELHADAKINTSSLNIYLSPADEDSSVVAQHIKVMSGSDWGTLTFNGIGNAKITITDYWYCTPTVAEVYVSPIEKFVANNVDNQNAYTQITLGDLFGIKNGATIGNVTATVTDPSGNVSTVDGTSADWATKAIDLTKDGEWKVSIKDDDEYCAPSEVTFTVNTVDKFEKKFDKDFLYRVGNASNSPVALGYLFGEIKTDISLTSVSVTVENIAGNAAGTSLSNTALTDGKIQFSGTGVVKVTISANGANAVELNLEVINATNLTSASGTTSGGNLVLLCDVNTATYVNYWDCTLFGNGFTYSLNGAPTAYNSKQGHGVLITKNTTLDNLVIVGDIYNQYGAFTTQDYYNSAVDVVGDTIIQNCYIANCAAPVSTREDVTIINTTLYGGTVANLIIKSGTATLENITTANYDDGRALVGMGIVIHSDATESAKLVLKGTLTQYNFINEESKPTDTYAQEIHEAMFGSNCSKYHFGTSPDRYANAGIISLTSLFDKDKIEDYANTGYVGTPVSLNGVNGYVYSQANTNGAVNNNYDKSKDPHFATTQGAVAPEYSFDYTSKNYQAKQDGSNDYCYEENGTVHISMDKGDTFNWDTSILTATKVGQTLSYTVSMNGTDYTGKKIAFNTAGVYDVIYTYTDSNNYSIDADGNITTYNKTYTKTVKIAVAVVEAATKHAEFTFGSSNTASTTVTIGNNTYVMPNVSGTSSTIGSTTVSGQTIYYPIVEIVMSDNTTSHTSAWYAYFPVFSGAVTITDYKENGTGDPETFGSSTQSMPEGLSVVGDPASLFKYQSSSTAGTSPVVKNKILVYSSPSISKKRDEYSTVVQYSYTDNAGATYYYYIGYHAPAQRYTTCVTADTFVTLADGTQKRIDEVTYADKLLVWDFDKGAYTTSSSIIIENHGYGMSDIIKLTFADGAVVKVVNVHGFFDADLNKWVDINASNAQSYVGHSFIQANGNSYETVKLVAAEVTTEYVEAWSILTADQYNCMLEGMFSITPPATEQLAFFEIGENMKYDAAAKQADIEKYGLFTYEEFAHLLTVEQFDALNLPEIKVAIGKGLITYEEILWLIATYVNG